MQIDDSLIGTHNIENAIDKNPLIVPPDALLSEVIALMSQTRGHSCYVSDADRNDMEQISKMYSDIDCGFESSMKSVRSSCVLIMDGRELVGILTERDIVRMAASAANFAMLKIAEVMASPVITLSEKSFKDIFAALFLFRRYRIRHLVVVDGWQNIVGIVTPQSIRQILRPSNLLKMRRVSEIMSTQIVYAPPTASVISLAQMMADNRVSCVVIVEVDDLEDTLAAFKPVGIVTERDIVQYQALGLNLINTEAQVVMSTPLFLLKPEDSLWFAHNTMQKLRVQRLVVSWNWGAKLGIVTQSSLLKIFDPLEMYGVVETLQRTIAQLENGNEENGNKKSEINLANQSTVAGISLINPPREIQEDNLGTLVTTIHSRLKHLIDNPDLPANEREVYLNSALADIQNIRKLSNFS